MPRKSYLLSFPLELEGTVLSIIVDLNVDSWILRERTNPDRPIRFEEFLEAFFAFINSFIIQNHHNQLIVACYGNGQPYLRDLLDYF